MNSQEKDGAATLIGIIGIMFLVVAAITIFLLGCAAGNVSSQPAPATSTEWSCNDWDGRSLASWANGSYFTSTIDISDPESEGYSDCTQILE